MVAPHNARRRTTAAPAWHQAFLAMAPTIRRYAQHAFREFRPEAREDAVVEVVASACVAFARLAELDKLHLAYPTVLANYGIRQFLDHRRVGNRRCVHDVLSPFCQKRKHVKVGRLDHYDAEEGEWLEALVEDKHAGPAETAAARLDLGDWFRSMPHQKRKIAEALAAGERTCDVARRFGLSAGRISQLRTEFRQDWRRFQGD